MKEASGEGSMTIITIIIIAALAVAAAAVIYIMMNNAETEANTFTQDGETGEKISNALNGKTEQ